MVRISLLVQLGRFATKAADAFRNPAFRCHYSRTEGCHLLGITLPRQYSFATEVAVSLEEERTPSSIFNIQYPTRNIQPNKFRIYCLGHWTFLVGYWVLNCFSLKRAAAPAALRAGGRASLIMRIETFEYVVPSPHFVALLVPFLVATLRWLRLVELLSQLRYNGAGRYPFKQVI